MDKSPDPKCEGISYKFGDMYVASFNDVLNF